MMTFFSRFFAVFLLTALCWSGSAPAATLGRAELVRELDGHLRTLLEDAGGSLRLASVHYNKSLTLPDGAISWEVNQEMDGLRPGRRAITVTALVDGHPEATLRVSAVLKQWLRLPVARHGIDRGDVVSAADFRWEERELTRPVPGLVREIDSLVGMAATRRIREGVILRKKWFDAPMAVDRGERVRIRVIRGGLKIETTAVSLGKGRVGDLIQVRNPKSNIRYEARVTGPGRARVQTW